MTRLHRDRNWKIEVFGREHGIPHFHLRWPEGRASIGIEDLEVLIGSPPAKIFSEARRWASDNKEPLWAVWHELNGESCNETANDRSG